MRNLPTLLLPLIWLIIFSAAGMDAHALGPNDVSILQPLPSTQELPHLLKPENQGSMGKLLPKQIYDLFPDLVRFVDAEKMYRDELRVVAIRLDPCFAEGRPPLKCRKQIRLVWQPIETTGKTTTTLDAAVHTFYEFDDATWAALLRDWQPLVSGTSTDALDIHPRLRAEGYDSTYWRELKSVVLKHCGEKNLVRTAAMLLNGPLMWTFLGFDIQATPAGLTSTPITIPRLPTGRSPRAQSFVMDFESLTHLEEFNARVAPAPTAEQDWVEFLLSSIDFKTSRPESDLKAIADRAFQFENPRLNNPGTLDCISCHAAQTARLWSEKNQPHWNWVQDFAASRFASPRNLENLSVRPLQTNRLRGFGYFEDEPLMSQRVVNETALVLDALETSF